MAIHIEIKKKLYQSPIYYYKVNTAGFGGMPLYMGINPQTQELLFFDKDDFSLPIKILKRDSKKPIGTLPQVPDGIFGRIVLKGLKALIKNEFPDHLDYYA